MVGVPRSYTNHVSDRRHRLIHVDDLAAEVAADWVATQTLPPTLLASEPNGIQGRPSRKSVEMVMYWLDTNGAVVHATDSIGVRPVARWTTGGTARYAWDEDEVLKPPSTAMQLNRSNARGVWLKVTSAPTPPGSATHLAIDVSEAL